MIVRGTTQAVDGARMDTGILYRLVDPVVVDGCMDVQFYGTVDVDGVPHLGGVRLRLDGVVTLTARGPAGFMVLRRRDQAQENVDGPLVPLEEVGPVVDEDFMRFEQWARKMGWKPTGELPEVDEEPEMDPDAEEDFFSLPLDLSDEPAAPELEVAPAAEPADDQVEPEEPPEEEEDPEAG